MGPSLRDQAVQPLPSFDARAQPELQKLAAQQGSAGISGAIQKLAARQQENVEIRGAVQELEAQQESVGTSGESQKQKREENNIDYAHIRARAQANQQQINTFQAEVQTMIQNAYFTSQELSDEANKVYRNGRTGMARNLAYIMADAQMLIQEVTESARAYR